MKKALLLATALLTVGYLDAQSSNRTIVQSVNPFIGTDAHGHTHPAATRPFGMVQLGPDTRLDPGDWDGSSGYHYSDSLIYGFSHTHLSGTGVSDYCDVLFQPYCGRTFLQPQEYASRFQKKNERASPGYYSVFLDNDRIQCELTATERVGVHRYTFPTNREQAHLLIDLRFRDSVLDSHLEVVNDHEIAGYRISKSWAGEQHVYFVARFSKRFFNSNVLDLVLNPHVSNRSVSSKAVVGILDFYHEGEPIVVTVGLSGTSVEGARRNLEAECPTFDFDQVWKKAEQAWADELSKIEISGATPAQQTTFYTALYHALLAPNVWSDADGQYRGRDNQVHPNPGHAVYSVFSLWDTYRACLPLQTLLAPERVRDFVKTFLRQYEQGGRLPVWELSANETDCMIGYHSAPVIWDAYSKGLVDAADAPALLDALVAGARRDNLGLNALQSKGYIPSDVEPEAVSKTLEYAFDDWCIAQLARSLGRSDVEKDFLKRAQAFKNVFDPSTGFFRGKTNATWVTPFDPREVNFHFTEANAWQYRFAVQHDVSGLRHMLGGRFGFEAALDSLFELPAVTTGRNQADITGLVGQYAQGNEPCHHVAYLYQWTDHPSKTQRRVREVLNTLFTDRPDGLCGNDDCGQMSAWYVWSALGLYPVLPGSGQYVLGGPLFEKATIRLSNGQKMAFVAPGNGVENLFVQQATRNGQAFSQRWLGHDDLLRGGDLTLQMGPAAADNTWAQPASRVCRTALESITPVPFVKSGKRVFEKEQRVELDFLSPFSTVEPPPGDFEWISNTTLYCEYPGSFPLVDNAYEAPILLRESGSMRAQVVFHNIPSAVETAEFLRKSNQLRVLRYNTTYSPQYTGGGPGGLTDLISGGRDFRAGGYQGYEGVNLDVVLDLGKKQKIKQLSAHFLQDENSWIFYPTSVRWEVSDDGVNFRPAGEVKSPISPEQRGLVQHTLVLPVQNVKARYVRVVGVSLGQCPAWHKGAGHPCWLFVDELGVE